MLEFSPWGIAVILSVLLLADTYKGKICCVQQLQQQHLCLQFSPLGIYLVRRGLKMELSIKDKFCTFGLQ